MTTTNCKSWPHLCLGLCISVLGLLSNASCSEANDAAATDGSTKPPKTSQDANDSPQWHLPKSLKEISGLALTADQRLLAVADEQAVVFELDYLAGKVVKAFAFGKPAIPGDFEGIAVHAGLVYLITSKGRLYRGREGEDGEHVTFEHFDTGLTRRCEAEGLAASPDQSALYIACKTRPKRTPASLWSWSIDDQRLIDNATLVYDEKKITKTLGKDHFSTSGLAFLGGQHIAMISARQEAYAVIDKKGELVRSARLPGKRKRHRQSEGLAITPDNRWIIADEGGSGSARLSVYPNGL